MCCPEDEHTRPDLLLLPALLAFAVWDKQTLIKVKKTSYSTAMLLKKSILGDDDVKNGTGIWGLEREVC